VESKICLAFCSSFNFQQKKRFFLWIYRQQNLKSLTIMASNIQSDTIHLFAEEEKLII